MSSPKKKPEEQLQRSGNMMYIGPTINGVVRHSTVFANGKLPAHVQKRVEECPMMAQLFVKIDVLPERIKDLNKKTGRLYEIYVNVAEKFNSK